MPASTYRPAITVPALFMSVKPVAVKTGQKNFTIFFTLMYQVLMLETDLQQTGHLTGHRRDPDDRNRHDPGNRGPLNDFCTFILFF